MPTKTAQLRTQSERLDRTMTRLGKTKNDQFADYQDSIENVELEKMSQARRLSRLLPIPRGNVWLQLGRMISPKFAD